MNLKYGYVFYEYTGDDSWYMDLVLRITIAMFISRKDSIKLRCFLISILLGARYICYKDTHQGSFSCKMPFSKDVQSCKEVSNFICRSDAHMLVPHRWQILYLR